MAFESKNFIICSRFPLFRASGNLWMYKTLDSLESILADVDTDGYSLYFRPRENLKNHDSPDEGDVILLFVEDSKLAYLKVVGRIEKPYKIKVARTYLENEDTLLALITELQLEKASKETDFATPITDENLGITQTEQTELEGKIDLAANSGRMITEQGFWYAKMYSETVAPSAEDGTNYADFSQTDGQGNPIIVTYNRTNGVWVQDQTITPPADYDGYVPITSKIWDIDEQDGQQGGRILWNHTSKQFTPYPQIVSFDSIEITGDSTVEMPQNPSDDNIANVGFVKQTIGGARNIGDIFLTKRTDNSLNGAVECDGATYNTTDFTGVQSIGNLLALNKIPYISLSAYAAEVATKGWCDKFGWDGVNTYEFRVPTLSAYILQKLQLGIKGSIGTSGSAKYFVATQSSFSQATHPDVGAFSVSVANNQTIPGANVDVTSEDVSQQRCMVQLATSASDEAVETCTGVLADVAGLKDMNNITPTGKETVVSWSMPDTTAGINIGSYATYTFDSDGWLVITTGSAGSVQYTSDLYVADTYSPFIYGCLNPNGAASSNFYPVQKGETVTKTYSAGNWKAMFYPIKGAQ